MDAAACKGKKRPSSRPIVEETPLAVSGKIAITTKALRSRIRQNSTAALIHSSLDVKQLSRQQMELMPSRPQSVSNTCKFHNYSNTEQMNQRCLSHLEIYSKKVCCGQCCLPPIAEFTVNKGFGKSLASSRRHISLQSFHSTNVSRCCAESRPAITLISWAMMRHSNAHGFINLPVSASMTPKSIIFNALTSVTGSGSIFCSLC